jgi:hypothetical protein
MSDVGTDAMFYATQNNLQSHTMSGLDTLFVKSLENKIKENHGDQIFQRIHERVFDCSDAGFVCAPGNFQKLDNALREFFGSDAEEIEKQIINEIVTFGKQGSSEQRLVIIEDKYLVNLILESFGDEDKKNILNAVIDRARTIPDIYSISNIPQTSGYRKIRALVQNGMLIPHGFSTHDRKKVAKYRSIFENVRIEIEKDRLIIMAKPTKESLKNSEIVRLVCP